MWSVDVVISGCVFFIIYNLLFWMHHGKYHMTIYRLQNIATKIMPVNERVNFFYKVAIFKVNNLW
jgi:hypothetical protein